MGIRVIDRNQAGALHLLNPLHLIPIHQPCVCVIIMMTCALFIHNDALPHDDAIIELIHSSAMRYV
jgi:hypothetical protein